MDGRAGDVISLERTMKTAPHKDGSETKIRPLIVIPTYNNHIQGPVAGRQPNAADVTLVQILIIITN